MFFLGFVDTRGFFPIRVFHVKYLSLCFQFSIFCLYLVILDLCTRIHTQVNRLWQVTILAQYTPKNVFFMQGSGPPRIYNNDIWSGLKLNDMETSRSPSTHTIPTPTSTWARTQYKNVEPNKPQPPEWRVHGLTTRFELTSTTNDQSSWSINTKKTHTWRWGDERGREKEEQAFLSKMVKMRSSLEKMVIVFSSQKVLPKWAS